ncbi:hypothetical protein [Bremerella sp. P1]|uniref:hypothetical protein n=1 Tax=Bremerella sp. P1 TaxID=3026424 RepID=UPI002368D395|nr:hypothetical protein [Bremerella sp. P1]WDI45255.1 hypothetical protein PSR63_27160 [Bremerella sp. P1]
MARLPQQRSAWPAQETTAAVRQATTRTNILSIVDTAQKMPAGEATSFMEEQIPTFEEYVADPESPYADLYKQILEQAKSAASGQDVSNSLKEIKDLAGQLPAKNP